MTVGGSTFEMEKEFWPWTHSPAKQPYLVKIMKQTNNYLKSLDIGLHAYIQQMKKHLFKKI